MSVPNSKQTQRDRVAEETLYWDKRLLVLFCFGLLLVGLDIWPYHWPRPASRFVYNPKLHCVQVEQAPALSVFTSVHQQTNDVISDKVQLFSSLHSNPDVPVELDLFLNQPLRINRASESTLTMLPGVGPRLAGAIVAMRNNRGVFTGPEDLLRVPGIGTVRLQQLGPLVSYE